SWAPWCPALACGHRGDAPVAAPHDRAVAVSYDSSASPPVATAHAGADSRTVAGSMPARAAWSGSPRRRDATTGSGPRCGPPQALSTPDAGSPRSFGRGEPPLLASRRASEFFCADVLQHGVVQHRLRQQLLQLGVLVLQNLQAPGLRDIETAVLRLPFIEGGVRDAVPAAHIPRGCSDPLPPRDPDDLPSRDPRSLHRPPPSQRPDFPQKGRSSWGSGQRTD